MKIYTTECRMTHLKRLYVEIDGSEYKTDLLHDDDSAKVAAMLRECANELDRADLEPLGYVQKSAIPNIKICGGRDTIFPEEFEGSIPVYVGKDQVIAAKQQGD